MAKKAAPIEIDPEMLSGVELLRVGTFTSAEGREATFTKEDLQSLADAYDPAVFESPAVVGHPRMNDPAYGWVKGLRVEGDKLIGDIGDVVSSFADAVRKRVFSKVSVQVWPRGSKASPRPDVPYLKHVGFLGAAAPAVKGLRPVSFSDGDQDGCTTIEADIPDPSIQPPTEISMSEANQEMDAELKARADKLAEAEAKLAADKARHEADVQSFAESQAAARKADALSFAEGLVADGKLAPAGKDQVAYLHELLAADDVQSFGEGDDAQPAYAVFRSLFDGANPVISLGEAAPRQKGAGEEVDLGAEELAEQALSFAEEQAAKGKPISIQQAVRHVQGKAKA